MTYYQGMTGPRWLPERLVAARKDKGLSHEKLARLVGVSRPAVSAWESGASEPSGKHLLRLSQVLGKPASYFYGEEEPEAEQQVEGRAVAAHANGPPPEVDLAEWERQARERLEALIQEMRRDWEERQRRSRQC